ncbi:MAG TPA: hypothetical protein VIL31_14910 [Cyclobacteriaceae bacterium]
MRQDYPPINTQLGFSRMCNDYEEEYKRRLFHDNPFRNGMVCTASMLELQLTA